MHYRRIELPAEWPVRNRIDVRVVMAVVLHAVVLLVVSLCLDAPADWLVFGLG